MNKSTFTKLFLSIILLVGIFFLYMGYREFLADVFTPSDHKTTNGYFMKYDMDTSTDPVTYKLTYSYVVKKQTYFVNAKNKLKKLPPLGSQKKIKYQTNDPQKSVVVELIGGEKYIIAGLIFLLVATFGIVNRLLNLGKESNQKFYKIAGIISGLLLIIVGGLIYYFYGYAIGSSGILDIWDYIKWMTIIPFIPFLAGCIIIITAIFFDKEESF